jgi:parallel beta-helix repeat protein
MLFLILVCTAPALAQTTITQAKALDGLGDCDTPGFPVTICERGSYVLKSNLRLPNWTTTAIEVVVDDVTIDLNGFAIVARFACLVPIGQPCPREGVGVDATGRDNVAVVNGTVRGMGTDGIRLGDNGRVEKVRALANGSFGIRVGESSTVTGNTVTDNGDDGILASEGSIVTGNTARRNGGDGLSCTAGGACSVTGNTAHRNAFSGIRVSGGSVLIGNTGRENGREGLSSVHNGGTSGYTHNAMFFNGTVDVGLGLRPLGRNLCNHDLC